jgi:hypothetical protein
MPFCGVELAERIERVEMQLITTATAACYAEQGSPLNKVVGLGFGGVPSDPPFDQIEQAFATRACAPQVELSNLADPAVGAALTGRGYQLVSFEIAAERATPWVSSALHPRGPGQGLIRTDRSITA